MKLITLWRERVKYLVAHPSILWEVLVHSSFSKSSSFALWQGSVLNSLLRRGFVWDDGPSHCPPRASYSLPQVAAKDKASLSSRCLSSVLDCSSRTSWHITTSWQRCVLVTVFMILPTDGYLEMRYRRYYMVAQWYGFYFRVVRTMRKSNQYLQATL